MFTTFMHLGSISICMAVLSLFGIHLWIWLSAIASVTITIYSLVMNSYFKGLIKGFLAKHPDEFDNTDEMGIMTVSPGVFIPQIMQPSNLAATDLAASLGWARILSVLSVVLGLIFSNYIVLSIGGIVFLVYLFSHIGGMFYNNNPDADMFSSTRRYLSSKSINVKSLTDVELVSYAIKYEEIVRKLKRIVASKEVKAALGVLDEATDKLDCPR